MIAAIPVILVLMLGFNEIRGVGISFTSMKDAHATKQLLKEYIAKDYEACFKRLDVKKRYSNLVEGGLDQGKSYDSYYTESYKKFVEEQKSLEEQGISIKNYSLRSLSKREDKEYSITYDIEVMDNGDRCRDISIELVGHDGNYMLYSIGYRGLGKEELVKILNESLFFMY